MTVIVSEKGSLYFYTADTLARFIDRIGRIKTSKKLYYRGLTDIKYDLSPSVNRPIDKQLPMKTKWLTKEKELIEFAEQILPDIFEKQYPTLMISNMQHYGIPTRMLDVTGNALVALYFACCNHDDKDGKVVVFEAEPVSAYNSFANIIADTYRLTTNGFTNVNTYLNLIEKQTYANTLSYPGWEIEKEHIISILREPLLVDVGIINMRQRNQDGKFLLFPNRIEGGKVLNELIDIDATKEIVKAEIKIPKESKKKIREQLRYVGITDAFVFPDDIQKVLNDLKKRIVE